jgi:hypothetical protein
LIFESAPTARLARVFFTTVIRKPFSRSLRRMRLFFTAFNPRGLMTATASIPFNRSAVSFSIRLLTFLLMITSGFGCRDSGFG